MRDPGLEAFVAAIERHLSKRRATEHVLSPRDFALARRFFENGLPLAAVLTGIDRAFAQAADCSSLAFCERFVEREARGRREARAPHPQTLESPSPDARERLEALAAALRRSDRPLEFEKPSRQLGEILDLVLVATQPNWAYLNQKLRELDDAVEDAAVRALSETERAAFCAEAARALARQRSRVDAPAHAAAQLRYLGRRARARFALPRVSLA